MDSRRLFALALMLGVFILPVAGAVGLGDAKVISSLGQPLLIEIPLPGASATKIDEVQLRIGSQADFDRLSLGYDHAVSAMRLSTVQHDGQWWAQLRTRQPFSHPIVEFPLTLMFRGDRVVRAYTLLVDPPNYRQAVTPPTARKPPPPVRAKPSPKPRIEVAAARQTKSTGVYRVRPGDTLWPIAKRFKPAGMNTRQMMDALLRANPQAFINGDINLLRAGAELRLPGNAPSDATDAAGPVPEKPLLAKTAKPAAAPSDPGQVKERDRLQVITGAPDTDTDQMDSLRRRVLLTHEEVEKNRLEQQELRGELQGIKQELLHLERLVELKDEQIAALKAILAQRQAAASLAAQRTETTPTRPAAVLPPAQKMASEAPGITVAAEVPAAPPVQPFPWWWIVAPMILLLTIVGLMFYALYRRTESRPAVRLADLPVISNAPPPPYSQAQRSKQADGEPATRHAEGVAPANEDTSAQQGRPDREKQPTPPASPSLLDESLAELPSFSLHGTAGDLDLRADSGGTPSQIGVEEHVSEEELAELAKQLDAESELAISELSNTTAPSDSPSNDASDLDLSLDFDRELASGPENGLELDSECPGSSESSDNDAELTLDMARAYLELGDTDTAVELLQSSLEIATTPALRGQIQSLLDQYG